MLCLRLFSDRERFKEVKDDLFGEAEPRIYTVQRDVFRDCKGNRENAQTPSRMTWIALGKLLALEGTSKKDSRRLLKLRQVYRVCPSRV